MRTKINLNISVDVLKHVHLRGKKSPNSNLRTAPRYLGGTANTPGWSSAKPSGSLSSLSRVSTHVFTGLRWAGTTASHFLSRGKGQSAGGGRRSTRGHEAAVSDGHFHFSQGNIKLTRKIAISGQIIHKEICFKTHIQTSHSSSIDMIWYVCMCIYGNYKFDT